MIGNLFSIESDPIDFTAPKVIHLPAVKSVGEGFKGMVKRSLQEGIKPYVSETQHLLKEAGHVVIETALAPVRLVTLVGDSMGAADIGNPLHRYTPQEVQAEGYRRMRQVEKELPGVAMDVVFMYPGLGVGGRAVMSGAGRAFARFGLFGRSGVGRIDLEIVGTLSKHPLEGLTQQQVIQKVNQIGIKTSKDQLILWSGLGRGSEGVRLSQEYAALNSGHTLEMTPGGKWLNEMNLFGPHSPFSRVEAGEIWEKVSIRMIQQASGQVRSLVGVVNPSSIYRAEQSELLMNRNIIGLDELNLRPRYGFGNN